MGNRKERSRKTKLDLCMEEIGIDPEEKERVLQALSQEAKKKEIRYSYGKLELWILQLLSLPVGTVAGQALFLLFLPVAEQFLIRYTGISGWEIFPALSLWMAVGSLILVQELGKHFSCRMAELEQSCYFNLSQLWLIRVLSISGTDVLAAFLLGGVRANAYGFGWFPFAVYVLTPFFVGNMALLAVAERARGKNGIFTVAGAFLAGAGFALQAVFPRIYEKGWLPLWLIILAAAVCIAAWQVKRICENMEGRGETVCWN